MRMRSTFVSVLMSAALLMAGCTGSQRDEGGGGGGSDGGGGDAEPQSGIVDEDGFWTDARLPDPLASVDLSLPTAQGGDETTATSRAQILSLDSDGETVRMVGAWLRPTEGSSLGSRRIATGLDPHHDAPWARLVDEQAGTLIEPLQESDSEAGSYARRDACLCSSVSSRDAAEASQPDDVELFWVDFPAPESGEARIMLGESSAPTDPIPVSDGEPFENPATDVAAFDGDPSSPYGGADARSTVTSLGTTVRSVTGSNLSSSDSGAQLSVTSDVLFDFDSSDITDDGEKVLSSAADTLRDTAKGQEVLIVGHTDDQGEEDYNQKLSEERAAAVEDVLSDELDGEDVALTTEGRGEVEPLVPNADSSGDPIEDNQKQNRRVSFEYDPGEGADTSIDTGEELPDAPEMEETDTADGALASAILEQPGDRGDTDLRIDLRGLQQDGEYVRLDYAFALADQDARPDSTLFLGTAQVASHLHFGVNAYGDSGFPSGTHVSLIDEESGEQFQPVTAETTGCLCAEGAGTDRAAFTEPSPLFSYFPADVLERDQLTLRIADSGSWELDTSVLTSSQG